MEAFAEINRPAPEPKGTIDSLALLTQRFGRRAGDMKVLQLSYRLLLSFFSPLHFCNLDAEHLEWRIGKAYEYMSQRINEDRSDVLERTIICFGKIFVLLG